MIKSNYIYKNKKSIALLLFFVIAVFSFFINNKYYLPSQAVLSAKGQEGTFAKIYWDSGIGYNERESSIFQLTNKNEIKVDLPQIKIYSFKIDFLDNKAKVDSFKVISNNGTVNLKALEKGEASVYNYKNVDLKTASFKWTLFFIQLFVALLLTYLLYELLTYLKKANQPNYKALLKYIFIDNKHYVFWLMFLSSFAVFSLWLIGQWPGIMSVDSYHFTWREIKTFNFQNVTPWVYNLYILAITQFYDSPVVVGWFQIFVSALLGAVIFYYTYKMGANKFLILISILLYMFSIPIGIYNITLWKDIPFTSAMVFWGFFLFYLFYNKNYRGFRPDINILRITALVIIFILLLTTRHNGMIFLVAIPAILFILKLFNKKNLIQFFTISAIFYILITLITPSITTTDQKEVNKFFSMAYKTPAIAAIYSSKNYYSPDIEKDKQVVSKWESEAELKEKYSPVAQATTNDFGSRWLALSPEDQAYLSKIYYRRIVQNFHIFNADRTTMFLGSLGFSNNIFITTNELRNADYNKEFWRPMEAYKFSFSPKNLSLSLFETQILTKAMSFTGEVPMSLIFFNTFPFLMLLLVVMFLYKWFPASALYSFIFLFNIPFLYIVLTTCEWRYFYYLLFASYFVLPLLSLEYKGRKGCHDSSTL